MGTDNVIYLADRTDPAIPSYRRARLGKPGTAGTPGGGASADGTWHVMARQRGAGTRATPPNAAPPPWHATPSAEGAQPGAAHLHDEPRAVAPAGLPNAPGLPLTSPAHAAPPARRAVPTPLRPAAAGVRVAHPVDAAPSTGLGDGRLRISGRLIDVCAELERLAAAETLAALARRA